MTPQEFRGEVAVAVYGILPVELAGKRGQGYAALAASAIAPIVDKLVAELRAERDRYLHEAAMRSEDTATVSRVRVAVNTFCHGEQAYAEHTHYCEPILRALDPDDYFDDREAAS